MTRITRYGRKVKTTFISTMFAACIAIVIGIPFVSKNMFNNDVGYYSISIRGTHVQPTQRKKLMWHWQMHVCS